MTEGIYVCSESKSDIDSSEMGREGGEGVNYSKPRELLPNETVLKNMH